MNKDYYKILGLDNNASEEDIKTAYKKLVMKYHPDRNQNDPECEEKFKEIKNAYEVLTGKNHNINESSYKNYNTDFNSVNNSNFSDFMDVEESLDDVFRIIFQNELRNNQNIISILDIDLEQAFYGSEISLKIIIQINCIKCNGKGHKIGSNVKVCQRCSGTGLYIIVQGLFTFKQKCSRCDGKGYAPVNICDFCDGEGKLDEELIGFINIRPNSIDNSTVIFNLLEDFKRPNLDNDMYVLLKIKPHPFFLRSENRINDLICNILISFTKAILGGVIKIYTLYGYVLFKIKQGVQNNDSFKIRNKGLNFNGEIGNLYFEVLIEIPIRFNFYQKLLIKRISVSIKKRFLNYPLVSKWESLVKLLYFNILKV